MTKYQFITGIYESMLQRVTGNPSEWAAFMRSACRNYKCRFDEQILIYAQRPDATAVLEIEKWNKQFGRWVNKGATGIAVFDDEHNGNYRLKHYFDISDTHGSRFTRPVPLWQIEQRYETEVIESIENSFGELEDKSTLADALISAAKNAVDDNIIDYLHELMQCREDSFLEDLDEFNVEVAYRTALQNSVSYMLLTRCGIDAEIYFNFEDFQSIVDFNTRQTVNALGIASSDIAETCLREISATVINLQKQERNQNRTFAKPEQSGDNIIKNSERSFEHGSIDISDGGRLQSTQSDRAGGKSGNPWQVRITPKEISETASQDIVRESADGRDAQPASDGNRADSSEQNGTVDRTDGESRGRDGADESHRPNEMGRIDEQHPALSGGNDTERPDLQLNTDEKADGAELSAFSMAELAQHHHKWNELLRDGIVREEKVINAALNSDSENTLLEIKGFLEELYNNITFEIIDSSTVQSKDLLLKEVKSYFYKDRKPPLANQLYDIVIQSEEFQRKRDEEVSSAELPAFLDEVLIMGIIANPNDDLKYNKKQIELYFSIHTEESERGEYLKSAYQDRYTELIVDGKRVGYKPQDNGLLMWEGAYLSRTAESVFSWGLAAGFTAELIDQKQYYVNTNIKPLKSVESQQMSLFGFADYSTGNEQPQLTLFKGFEISQQVIDEALCLGGNEPNCLERICAYFAKNYPLEQNAAFLKEEYRTDGKGFYFDNRPISLWYDENGIRISEGRTAGGSRATVLTWEDTAKRIRELLDMGRYVPQSVLDKAATNEYKETAETVCFIVQDFADETRDAGWLRSIQDIYNRYPGFPEKFKNTIEFLKSRDNVATLIEEMTVFVEAYRQNHELLRFHFHRPVKLLSQLQGLQRERIEFTAQGDLPPAKQFITDDEIDKLLTRGGNVHHGKLRIYSYYLQNHDTNERIKFLKNEYGWGGSGRLGFNENHDGKGISYSRENNQFEPYDKVLLPWNKVEKRIGELIKQNRYMNAEELAYIPTYEKEQVARSVYHFFSGISEDTPCPFPRSFDYSDGYKYVTELMGNPVEIEKIYQMMLPVWESATQDDHYYSHRKEGFDDFCAYRNGTFSLFGERKEPRELPAVTVEQPAEKETDQFHDLAVRLVRFYQEFDYYDYIDSMELDATDEDAVSALSAELHFDGSRSRILETLQMLSDEIDPEEETAIDLELFIEELQALSDEPLPVEPEHTTNETAQSLIGQTLTIDGRNFQIDSVDEDFDKVSLRDITFQNGTGFPIFRSETINFVRKALAKYQEQQELQQAVSDKLAESKWAVSDELIENGIEEYRMRGGSENAGDIADFIEDSYLSDEAEPDEPAWEQIKSGEVTHVRIDLIPDKKPAEKETLAPPRKKQERIHFTALHPEIPKEQRHNFRISDPQLGNGTASEKYAANVAAIRLLKQIEDEERLATPEEQEILSRYVGWGGLSDCFEETHAKNGELKNLLDEDEYTAARASTLTAFYTSPVIIEAMYQALSQMGFQTGNILEPSCGVGNFIGMLPDSMADNKAYGVEIDSISGRIARQLYQNSNIAVNGFEKVDMPDSFFDVAVGNVPFGDFKVIDRRYDKNKWLIHDYFFSKTLDKVRPGGIVAFITSKGTMDKENSAVRKYLAQRADLIGAIRLPNNAFKRNAGTEVTSDIIFLQKRDRIVDIEPDWVYLDTDENGIRMNSYFVQHPDMVLGDMVMESTQFGMDSACRPYENADLSEQLKEVIPNLHAEISEYEADELEEEDNSIPANPEVRNFSYTVVDGKVYFRENSRMHPVEMSVTTESRIRGMIAMRDCVRELIFYQTEDYPDELIQSEQAKLNRLYDSYTKKYGLLCSRGNSLAFGEDSSYCLLCSLEVLDDEGNFERKADMFTKRTIKPHVAVTSVDTASEALAVSISEKARVDLSFMAQLSGKDEETLINELKGVIFLNVGSAQSQDKTYVTADEYLSGNVRKKLEMARAAQAAVGDGSFDVNVQALEAVQPEDLTVGEIGVRIGATWIPPEIYRKFMFELLDTGSNARRRMNIIYSKCTGEWNISEKNSDYGNIKALTTYGTKRISAYHIFEQTLNLKDVRVFDVVIENGDEKRVLNKKETAIAQDRQELIKSKFSEWLWKDIDRREMLCRIYNDTFNSIRPREYDGQHINFSGMNPEITLRKHQINAIAHVMYGGNTLLAHEVGAGKTYEMVAAAMESRRLGLCSKSMIVVPNHITEQWAAEWLQLYPSANILVATKKDFETKNRKKFCARISTGEYDAVIIGHSQFEKIPMSKERQEAILKRQIDELVYGIREAKSANCERYTVKQMEKSKRALENRLEKLNDQSRKDNVVTFEELGVNRMFIDESHYFKNLFLYTKMRNVGGIAQTEAQKSSDLFMKCQYLDELTGGKGVIFATGTPISNSMVELYTIQRYLQYATLQEIGMTHFDEWAANFGETITAIELSPEGTGYRAKTRFAKFFNLPELMSSFKEAADIQTADMLDLPVPKANYHTAVIKPSELQQEMVAGLAERAERIRNREVEPHIDNMLKITNDGRKLALDMRLINPLAPDDENGKVSVCVRNVYQIWERTKEQRSAQLVFCDLSTPKDDGSFNVYDDLKQKLIAKGVPEEEIAFIHEANTEVRKKELFAKVRSGQIRVLMGSTQKMGAGTNVQDRLIALHDLDCPWRPSDLAQRLGRIVRQGNKNPEVEIFRYVTEGTFDSYLYQLVENKQKFISQIMTSKTPLRAAEDVDETALSYSEIKALATGNPLIIEKCNLDMEVGKLTMLKANHLNQKYGLEEMVIRKYPEAIKRLTERIYGYEQDIQLVAANPKIPDSFPAMEIDGVTHTEKENAGKAIIDACAKMTGSDAVLLGQYRGFSMVLAYDSPSNEYRLTMKGTLSHTVVLGADIHGNITRLDNALEGFPLKLAVVREELENTKTQLENARVEMEAPFSKETELTQKTTRLKELNILLNMDEKDNTILDFAPDEGETERAPKVAGLER